MRSHAYFVVLDFTMLRIAQQSCMDEAEVSDVEEVFDHPRPFGAEEIWPRMNQAERVVITISELRRIAHRLPQADPDHAIVFARLVCLSACLWRRRLAWLRRDKHALAAGVVFPRMIRTHQPLAAYSTQRKLCSAMNA